MSARHRGPVSKSVSLDMAGDPLALWSMVSDVTRMGSWSPETVDASWLDGAEGPVPGARFKGRNRRGRASWSTTCTVVESEPGVVFAFAVGKPVRPSTVWRYRFEAAAPGRCLVTESFELPRPLSRVSRLITRVTTGVGDRAADLTDGMETTLANLAGAVENGYRG